MSNATATATTPQPQQEHNLPPPFQVEMGDDRGRVITFDHMRLRLRGRWSRSMFVGRDLGSVLNKMPDIPGLRIAIHPTRKSIRIYDPLEEDQARLKEINDAATTSESVMLKSVFAKFVHVPSVQHDDLDDDLLVSIMLEIAQKVYGPSPCMIQVQARPGRDGGKVPTKDEIKALQQSGALKGREIFDPWSNSNDKPKYCDQFKQWTDRWEQMMLIVRGMGVGATGA